MISALHDSVYESQPEEHAFRVTKVTGTIPADLSGAFFRSGPGLMKLGEHYLNFFDGHALIAGVSFADGAATFRSRFVRTPLYQEETAKKAVVKRRIFTNHPSRWSNLFALDFGNSAMHDVYAWGDGDALRVIAGNDPGHFALDPRTLETKGAESWGGAVPKGHETSPMPYRDPATGHLVGWIKKPGGLKPDQLKFVELDGAFRVVNETSYHALAGSPVIVHDQRATPGWFVATEQAGRLAAGQAIWGASTVWESFHFPAGATATLLLVPRKGDGPMVRVPLPEPTVIAFHVINAYDDGEHVIVDLVTYGKRIPFEAFAPPGLRPAVAERTPEGRLMRFRVDPRAGRVVDARPLADAGCELPEIADHLMGQKYRFAYFPTAPGGLPDQGFFGHFDAVCRIDVESGETRTWAAGCYVSAVAFVGRPEASSEDDGWLLTWLLRPEGAGVAVLDAKHVENGPVATLDLGVRLPAVSHTRWAKGVQLQP